MQQFEQQNAGQDAASAPKATNTAPPTPTAFLAGLKTASTLGSTVPANGDVNPYGIALVPTTVGKLKAGDLLISNFNDKANNQGRGTTIVEIAPAGKLSPARNGGTTVSEGGKLIQPLGLTLGPKGDILTANAGDGKVVETTPTGEQVATVTGDKKTGTGTLFGLVVNAAGTGLYYTDDGENTLRLLH